MPLDLLGSDGEGDGPLHRLGGRVKLVATLVFVVAVVATPIGGWRLLAAEGLILAFLVGLSGISPRVLATRWLGFLALVGFLALTVAYSHAQRAELGLAVVALTIVAKNSLAFVATLLLAHVTPFPELLAAMRGLGMPAVLVATLQFMHRYLHVLTDELDRMLKARRSRHLPPHGAARLGPLDGLIGILFLRAFERGERVHAAMLARGWDGTIRTLDATEARRA